MFLLVSTFLIVPVFAADHEGMAAQVRQKKVTINKKDVPVKEILEEIKQQTGFGLWSTRVLSRIWAKGR